jgi:hypothetical protein
MITLSAINVGSTANDGTGDNLRYSFQKCNSNFIVLDTLHTVVNGTSANWNWAYSTTYANSTNWSQTYTTFASNSGKWNDELTIVQANSGSWNHAYTNHTTWDGGTGGLNASTGRTSLGLGTLATQNANSVDIDGGNIHGTELFLSHPNSSNTPASSSAAGTTGQIIWDTNYIYVCVSTNTWKRSALSTW